MPSLMVSKSGREQIQVLTPATISTAGAATYTAAQMLGGIILRDPSGDNRTDVSPTAALLVAGVPAEGRWVNATYICHLINTADNNETITLTGGSSVTLVPATVTVARNENALLLVRLTDVRAGTETVTIYCMVAGG